MREEDRRVLVNLAREIDGKIRAQEHELVRLRAQYDVLATIVIPPQLLNVQDARMRGDLLEEAWGIIANAHGGDWSEASDNWRHAAERWRDAWLGSVTPDDATDPPSS